MISKADEVIDKVHHLLPPPQVVPRLMPLLTNANTDSNEVVKVINHDPSLTANVLRISNSAGFGGRRTIDTLDEAILRLGSQQVYRIVVAVSGAMALSASSKNRAAEDTGLLVHSSAAAIAAQLVASERGDDENVAFTAALLHDIGKIVLAAVSENFYHFAQESKVGDAALLETEERLLGVTHPAVGSRLLERWQFPRNLVEAVRCHHQPSTAEEHHQLAGTINYANMVAYHLGKGYGHQPTEAKAYSGVLNMLEFTPEHIANHAEKTAQKLEAMADMFPAKAAKT